MSKTTTKIEPIKLKTNFVQNKPDQKSSTPKSQPVQTAKQTNLFDFDSEQSVPTKQNDDFSDFGDFVTPNVVAKSEPTSNTNVTQPDLFDFDSIQPLKTTNSSAPKTDLDDIFSIPSNEQVKTSGADLFQVFSNPTPAPQITSSFTMPNISTNQSWPVNNMAQKPVNPAQPVKPTPKPQANTMWDKLGQSVDINLDNLTPYSKGLNTKTNQNNIPMKDLMSQQSPKVLTSPPMSPNSNPLSKPNVQQTTQQTNQKSNIDLFDF